MASGSKSTRIFQSRYLCAVCDALVCDALMCDALVFQSRYLCAPLPVVILPRATCVMLMLNLCVMLLSFVVLLPDATLPQN